MMIPVAIGHEAKDDKSDTWWGRVKESWKDQIEPDRTARQKTHRAIQQRKTALRDAIPSKPEQP